MGFVEDFRAGSVKAIGVLEVVAAVGLILPAALDGIETRWLKQRTAGHGSQDCGPSIGSALLRRPGRCDAPVMTPFDTGAAASVRQAPSGPRGVAATRQHRWRPFLRHLLEMIVAMFAGMLLLDLIWAAMLPAFGAASLLDVPEVRALIMATDMTLGMSVWMAYRRHCVAAIAEMGGAMYVSFLVAFLPHWLGALSAVGAMVIGHVLMVPAMVAVMLLRRDEYTHAHHDRVQRGEV